jgi:5'-nucleotidase (lipoprotein e(P4) family)
MKTGCWIGLWLGCALVSSCASQSPAPPASPRPASADTLPDNLKWVQRSAEYYAAVVQTYRLATARAEQESATHTAGSWAVVLDADETVISNLQYQIDRRGLPYSAESWAAWVHRREATPLPGAARFLTRVHDLGGRTAIVTNRLQSECDDTAALFHTHALTFDAMLCRPDTAPSDKNPRFQAVAAGRTPIGTPLDIVAFIGDNILDFPGMTQTVRGRGEEGFAEFGVRYFLLPNPMYGSWQ